jgi:MFS family permease
LVAAALGAALFAVSDNYLLLLGGRALIGLGVAAAMTAGMKALVVWFPRERVPLLSGLMVTLGAMGALTATLPADFLIGLMGWRRLFELLAIGSAGCALVIYLVVPEARSATLVAGEPVTNGLRTVYTDPRFWRLAPLSATCIGTAWALQGLWAAPWLSDVEGLDRAGLLRYLFVMAIALSVGALLLSVTADRLSRRGIGPQLLFGLVATVFIVAQLALILRWPLPSYIPWGVVAAVGAATVLSNAILAEYFPKEIAGRANAALNLFHIGEAFVLQYMIGVVVQLWTPIEGRYPEVAYQTAFALNVVFQIAAGTWFALPWLLTSLRWHWRLRALRRSCSLHLSRHA